MTTTTSAPSPTGSTDTNGALIGSLWAGAESLISSYYPSATLSDLDVATLTWPSTVVIDGQTYTVSETSLSTRASSATSTPTSPATSSATSTAVSSAKQAAGTSAPASTSLANSASSGSSAPHSNKSDKTIGIAVGVSLGLVALGILLGCLFFLHRRRQRTGSFLRHQPPPDDEEIDTWRPSQQSSTHGSQSRIWAANTQYAHHTEPVPQMSSLGPPREMIPAYMRSKTNETSSSDSGNHPFFTPNESRAELEDTTAASRRHSEERVPLRNVQYQYGHPQNVDYGFGYPQSGNDRPSTPLVHQMMQSSTSPVSPVDRQRQFQQPSHQHAGYAPVANPFTSPEDDNPFNSSQDYEADNEYYSHPIPAKSPERRHSPQVHYPSGPEINGFDFGLANRQAGGWRSSEPDIDGGDGWRRSSVSHGQHELS